MFFMTVQNPLILHSHYFPSGDPAPLNLLTAKLPLCMVNLGEVENAKGTAPGFVSHPSSFLAEA